MMRKVYTLALALLMTGFMAQAQTADAIATKYVNAIGGAAKWKALKSVKQTIVFSTQGIEITGTVIGDASNRARVDMTAMGTKIVQAHDGTTAWWINPFSGANEPTKMPAAEGKEFMGEEFLDAMIDWKKRGGALSLEGEETIDGTDCYKLKLVKKDQSETLYYFSKENNLMVMSRSKSAGMGGQNADTYYADYTEQDGLMSPSKITVKVGGVVANTTTVNSIEYNVDVSDDLFAFPGN